MNKPTYRKVFLLSLGLNIITHLDWIIALFSGNIEQMMQKEFVDFSLPMPDIPLAVTGMFLFFLLFIFLQYAVTFGLLEKKGLAIKKIFFIFIVLIIIAIPFGLLSIPVLEGLLKTSLDPHSIRELFTHNIIITFLAVISSYSINFSKHKRHLEIEFEKLKAETIQTRYEALKNQVDPHFLFNSLNTLIAIVDISPEKTKDYIQKLSQVLRYALQNKETVSLQEEINFTKSYCSLVKIRYGDALIFKFDIAPETFNHIISPLSIQTLVENSVKHNIINKRQPLTVHIYTSTRENSITVSNFIQRRKQQEEGEGIGLANLSERYRLKWHKNIIIRESNNFFTVTIPLINYESHNYRG